MLHVEEVSLGKFKSKFVEIIGALSRGVIHFVLYNKNFMSLHKTNKEMQFLLFFFSKKSYMVEKYHKK